MHNSWTVTVQKVKTRTTISDTTKKKRPREKGGLTFYYFGIICSKMKFSSKMRSHTGTVGLDTQVNWPRWLSLVHTIKLQEEVMLGSHISTGRYYGLEVKYWPRQTLLSGRESASSPAPTHTDSSCSWLTRTLACTHSSHPSLEQIHLAMDFLICKSQSSE